MKKALLVIGIAVSLLAFGTLWLVPLSTPAEICRPADGWDDNTQAGQSLNRPMGIAWNDGYLYAADAENGAVKKISGETGAVVAEWNGFRRPVAVAAAGDGTIYVADFIADQVSKLAPDGSRIAVWGQHGSGPGEFDAPSGIAVGSTGDVFVADFYNHRIQKFTAAGDFVAQWGSTGRWSGQFRYPTDVAVNGAGAVFVADAYNHRIQKFTADGVYLTKWGGIGYGLPGKWAGWFRLAKALAIDTARNIYVADAFNYRIQKFSEDGRLIGIWGRASADHQPALRYPAGIAVAGGRAVYVTDFFENRIWKLNC